MKTARIICPNGHLGFAPLKPDSFNLGVAAGPDFIAADSGSDDIGPGPLGADVSTSPLAWQTQDLEAMLLASRKIGVPMLIGSAGDTGSNSRVDLYVGIIRELAEKHRLPRFKLGYYYSEVGKDYLRAKIRAGDAIEGLDGRSALTEAELDETARIVAMAGVHPFMALLDRGADVIIGGRSSDAAIFAAAAMHQGHPEALSYYLGKVLECASFCAEPYGAKETVLGEIVDGGVHVTAMHPDQRCTIASVAGHAMYERSNPYHEYVAGGLLDMSECHYEQVSEKTTRVTGPRFIPAPRVRVKLEGSAKVGERFIGIAAVRDPYSIANVDLMIDWARQQVRERFGAHGYELHYTVYGRDGVMGSLEPEREVISKEVGIVLEVTATTQQLATTIAKLSRQPLLHFPIAEWHGATTAFACLHNPAHIERGAVYRFNLHHVVIPQSPLELFRTKYIEIG